VILVTGGAGFIGSHTCVALRQAGYDIAVLDNFCNSKPEALQRVAAITGKPVPLVRADVRDDAALRQLFASYPIKAVIHFAGLKAVGDSVAAPLEYYSNNVYGSMLLAQVMAEFDVRTLVFSSSATVYGEPASCPIREDFPIFSTSPYAQSKIVVEHICRDLAVSDARWQVALLRYFNPVGAHESGTMGEDPNGAPANLLPFISQVAVGRRPFLSVWGNDYPTADGTGVRDYIHVMDLANGHVQALAWLMHQQGAHTFNLGTGNGSTVLEVVQAFERSTGVAIPYQIAPRRSGDVPQLFANADKARAVLGWNPQRDIDTMCRDAWRWQQRNPNGYPD
jgi:UDP-glucose 4-epimerase